jgi:outer membrane protein OmpA-like peptidoglycan-associated protein
MLRAAALLAVLAAAGPAGKPAAQPAPGSTPADLVDLLDFDQGTILLSSPPSYARGVGAWSPYGLADGDPARGWCSADGKPVGGEFVYELETDAELRTLRVHDAKAQESGYHGISVKALELWGAGASGPFRKIATFEAPRGADQEFPIPAGEPVRRVKLVIASNHGNAKFTEIMELDLLGRKLAAPPQADAGGEWYSQSYNGLRMKQAGTHVDGCYDYFHGVFGGELEGRVARVTWREFQGDGSERQHGTATFVVGPGNAWARGVWFNAAGVLAGEWDLRPANGKGELAKCTVPGSSAGDRLKKEGRLVLYGIRFDTNSDVPRADSEPALKQLLEALQGDPAMKLQVEGHTDATNTDAYNQDLSERRAKAVVAWLAGHGVDGPRLTPIGFGRTKPVASNDTAQGRALNRRVEVALPGR